MLLLSPYNSNWPNDYEQEKELIKTTLGNVCNEIHHIGSTSIPGLPAKPRLDILLSMTHPQKVVELLETIGYSYRGEINIPFQLYFKKELSSNLGVNLHCFEEGNSEIELNLAFRNYLRDHNAERDAYAELKKELDSKPDADVKQNSVLMNYTLGKQPFIQNILKKAGFDKVCLHFCSHHDEWAQYHELRKRYLFEPIGIIYDPTHPTLKDKNHYHFVLYKGSTIIGAAHIEFLEECAVLRGLLIQEKFQHKGYGSKLLSELERWCSYHGKRFIKLHSAQTAISFYKKHGYNPIEFDDISVDLTAISLGKTIKEYENEL